MNSQSLRRIQSLTARTLTRHPHMVMSTELSTSQAQGLYLQAVVLRLYEASSLQPSSFLEGIKIMYSSERTCCAPSKIVSSSETFPAVL